MSVAGNVFSDAAARALGTKPDIGKLFTPLKQWVKEVTRFSSQYDTTGWSAASILNAANVYPAYGDNRGAWAQKSCDKQQYIQIAFATPVYIDQIEIYETYNCGAVVQISALGPNKSWVPLWKADAPQRIQSSRIFNPQITPTTFKSNVLHLDLDCTADDSPDWCEIDAVLLHGRLSILVPPPGPHALGSSLSALINNPSYSDVCFLVENVKIVGHRNIMASRSAYFKDLFSANLDTKQPIPLPNVSTSAFMGLLQFIYTNDLNSNFTPIQLLHIGQAGAMFSTEGLCTLTDCYIAATLTVENVLPTLQSAPKTSSARTICVEFCKENFASITQSPQFATLPQHLLVELTQHATSQLAI